MTPLQKKAHNKARDERRKRKIIRDADKNKVSGNPDD